MKLQSTTFLNNKLIPERCAFGIKDTESHMALGSNKSPQLSWSEIPKNTLSLVLLCIDTDVPSSFDDFNKEVDELMSSLKKSSEEKEKLIQQIKAGETPKVVSKLEDSQTNSKENDHDEEELRDLSEWEKKLEGIS